MFPVIIDTHGVAKLIEKLDCNSSPGFDSINTKFLKSTSVYNSIILAKHFQQSLDTGALPYQWKVGKVVPLHKSGNRNLATNYRPISLTSTCCKLLEHIVFKSIVNFLEDNTFFSPSQHGFRKSYSCETQLVSFIDYLHWILDRSSSADCIFLDFAKAFGKVCHKLLIHKLQNLNRDANLLKWVECFLTNRSQYVTANGYDSSMCSVVSGVPQGSVLGPLLFLIYINDLPSQVTSNIHLFADYCVIFTEITSDDDCNCLQSDLNIISNWCSLWLMELNINKCKVVHVSRSPNSSRVY